MEVVAFIGPTGTGKSHRASQVAHDCGADAIIDDGLLIKDNRIVAGTSAKYETNKIRSVKKAIFADDEHAMQVRNALAQMQVSRVLVLGTSRNMVDKIIRVLELPAVSQVVSIHDVSTPAAIMKARETRRTQNKHIVPVPKIELQPHLPNFMIDPMRLFGKSSRQPRYHFGEVSVVRPNRFSVFGKLIISERAVAMIVREELLKDKAWAAVTRIMVKNMEKPEQGLVLKLDVTVRYGVNIPNSVRAAQDRIKMQVEYMTWMTVTDVDIFVRSIVAKV
ncbi:MAG: Asp23/Gls24 family envelope stress response protein [Negativicutes bacterium]